MRLSQRLSLTTICVEEENAYHSRESTIICSSHFLNMQSLMFFFPTVLIVTQHSFYLHNANKGDNFKFHHDKEEE